MDEGCIVTPWRVEESCSFDTSRGLLALPIWSAHDVHEPIDLDQRSQPHSYSGGVLPSTPRGSRWVRSAYRSRGSGVHGEQLPRASVALVRVVAPNLTLAGGQSRSQDRPFPAVTLPRRSSSSLVWMGDSNSAVRQSRIQSKVRCHALASSTILSGVFGHAT